MATLLQKNLAREIVKGKGRNKKELLVSAGYDIVTATASPGRTIEQKGVQEELKELGFDEDSAKRVVKHILSKGVKEENRLKAADMIFKVTGGYAPEKHENKNLNVNVSTFAAEAIQKAEEELKRLKTNDTGTPGN